MQASRRGRAGEGRWLALVLLLVAAPACADFPSLSRPWALGTPAGAGDPGMRLGADVSVAEFARAETPGTADPRLQALEAGGRLRLSLARGAWDATGDVILDTSWNVDSREYPERISLGVVSGAGSARFGAGFESGLYDGVDLELESAALPLAHPRGAFAPALVAWTRMRQLHGERELLLTPALGLASGATDRDAPGPALLLSAQLDTDTQDHPSGFGMLAMRWAGGAETPAAGARSPLGTPGSSPNATRWFVHASYAFPLERSQYARIVLGVGVGLDAPF